MLHLVLAFKVRTARVVHAHRLHRTEAPLLPRRLQRTQHRVQRVAIIEPDGLLQRHRQPGSQPVVAIVRMRHQQVQRVRPATQKHMDQRMPLLSRRTCKHRRRRQRQLGKQGPSFHGVLIREFENPWVTELVFAVFRELPANRISSAAV